MRLVITTEQKRALLAQRFNEPGYVNWQAVASAMIGGKPHFYVRYSPSCTRPGLRIKETIVWDGVIQRWIYKVENGGAMIGDVLRRYADKWVDYALTLGYSGNDAQDAVALMVVDSVSSPEARRLDFVG